MKFHELKAKNFMRFLDITLPLADQGLVLILGENRDAPKADSNGAGKSALLEALCWCLWGKTVRGLTDDMVVNETAGKDCFVAVEFSDDGHEYRVERYRKHSKHKKPNDVLLSIDGEYADGASMAITQQRINDILGLDFDTFCCMMPGAGVKVADLTDAAIKEHLENILQTKVISKAHEITKEKLKDAKLRLEKTQVELSKIAILISSLTTSIQKYEHEEQSFETSQKRAVADLKNQLEKIREDIEDYESKTSASHTIPDQIRVVKEQIEKKKKLSNDCHAEYLRILEEKTEGSSEINKEIYREDVGRDVLKRQLVSIQSLTGTCSKCLQPIDEEHRDAEALQISNDLKATEDRLLSLREKLSAFCTEKYEAMREPKAASEKYSADVRLLLSSLDDLEKSKIQAEADYKYLNLLIRQQESLTERMVEKSRETSPYAKLLANTLQRKVEAEATQASLRQEEADQEKEIEQLEFWYKGFSSKGIKSYMLAHVAPILEDRANYYAGILTDGEMKIEFYTERELKNKSTKEEFGIKVSQAHGSSSYTGNSTGERSRADLAIAFALGDLAATRANKRLPFRFLDEPFESIDDAGHESIVKLLAEQTQYDTVFCITHKQSFQQLFPKNILVIKENGVCTLELDENE